MVLLFWRHSQDMCEELYRSNTQPMIKSVERSLIVQNFDERNYDSRSIYVLQWFVHWVFLHKNWKPHEIYGKVRFFHLENGDEMIHWWIFSNWLISRRHINNLVVRSTIRRSNDNIINNLNILFKMKPHYLSQLRTSTERELNYIAKNRLDWDEPIFFCFCFISW